MVKNGKAQLSVDDIEQRKKDLNTELESVQAQIQKMDSMRVQLTAQGNAINGAIQQCDAFLQQLGESSPDSSIPSQGANPAINAVMS